MGFVCFILIIILISIVLEKTGVCVFDDEEEYYEEEVVVTQQVPDNTIPVCGTLACIHEGDGYFIIDPVSGEKVLVNHEHDRYQDADGKIWELK